MKKTEYISLKDQSMIQLLQQLGEKYSAVELIDEEQTVDVMLLARADFDYLISKLEDDERSTYTTEAEEVDFIDE